MDDSPLDLSPLDPKRDPAHFERLIRAVLENARRKAPEPWLALDLVQRWRPAMLAAAFLAAVSWLPSLTRRSAAPESGAASADPVEQVSDWASAGRVPSDVDPVQVLGRAP